MAYNQEVWQKAKTLFELGKSLQDIADECKIKDRTSITKRAKKENWIKAEIQQLKNDIIDYEEQNSTLDEKKSTLVEKLASLSDFKGVTTIQKVVEDEIGRKSLLFSTATLSLIRKNQMLTKNTKQVIAYETIYSDNGKPISRSPIAVDVELEPNDIKVLDDGIDKNAITTELAKRHNNIKAETSGPNVQENQNLEIVFK